MRLLFHYDDGGRAAAGYRGRARDCATRAIAIATQHSYQEVYQALAAATAQAYGEGLSKRARMAVDGHDAYWFRMPRALAGRGTAARPIDRGGVEAPVRRDRRCAS